MALKRDKAWHRLPQDAGFMSWH